LVGSTANCPIDAPSEAADAADAEEVDPADDDDVGTNRVTAGSRRRVP
jgi:hypothetical protein